MVARSGCLGSWGPSRAKRLIYFGDVIDGRRAAAWGLRLENAPFGSVFAAEDARSGLRSFVTNGPRSAQFEGP